MTDNNQSIKIEPNPTAKDEAKTFESLDEKAREHELALIRSQKGWIGFITGSTNETLNTGTFILILVLLLLAGCLWGSAYHHDIFAPYIDNLFKAFFTVVGFVVGVKISK